MKNGVMRILVDSKETSKSLFSEKLTKLSGDTVKNTLYFEVASEVSGVGQQSPQNVRRPDTLASTINVHSVKNVKTNPNHFWQEYINTEERKM